MPASEQGVNRERYMLVPRTLIFLTRKTQVLLLHGAKDKHLWPGLYNGVGGHIEQGEDVLGAAHREIREETGLAPSSLWLCGIVTVDTQTNPGVCIFILKGECSEGEPTSSKEGSLEWVDSTKIDRLPLVADLRVLLPKILSAGSGETPFSARSSYNDAGELTVTIV